MTRSSARSAVSIARGCSDEPGGPVFDWVDITGIGTPVPLPTGDDSNAPGIPIGFSFPFYGKSFGTVKHFIRSSSRFSLWAFASAAISVVAEVNSTR